MCAGFQDHGQGKEIPPGWVGGVARTRRWLDLELVGLLGARRCFGNGGFDKWAFGRPLVLVCFWRCSISLFRRIGLSNHAMFCVCSTARNGLWARNAASRRARNWCVWAHAFRSRKVLHGPRSKQHLDLVRIHQSTLSKRTQELYACKNKLYAFNNLQHVHVQGPYPP